MNFKHLRRYRQVLKVLLAYGLDDMMGDSSIRKVLPKFIAHNRLKGRYAKHSHSRHERIRMAIEDLGPTFIKFGQILSNRVDILPRELITELEKLQDAVPSFSFEDIRGSIENSLGGKVENLFAHFEPVPLASASIAQVHRARLHSGDEVVVKVQRPDIADIIEIDLQILADLAEIAEHNFQQFAAYEPVALVRSLKRSMTRELNFLLEANNIIKFRAMFANDEEVYIPKVFTKLSTRSIMCMEFIKGVKVNQVTRIREMGYNPTQIANVGLRLYFAQIFKYGLFHADPHPGNVLLMDDGRIGLIDFGMVGVLNTRDRRAFRDFMIALTQGDFKKLVLSIEKLTQRKRIINKEELEYDLGILLDEFPPHTVDERNMSEVVDRLQELIYKHKLCFPADFFLLLRTMVILDGISRILDPEFNTLEHIRKNAILLYKQNIEPTQLIKHSLEFIIEAWEFISAIPSDIKGVMEKIKDGKLKVEVIGLNPLMHMLDVISSRIAAAIILASMIVGSSLVVLSGIPPKWAGIPIIGLIGITVSGIYGMILIISIFRGGKY
jgi:ubiquinone biosynthesis protein